MIENLKWCITVENRNKYPTMWPNVSQMKPEPVPSTFAFSSSTITTSSVLFGLLMISRSLMKTTDGDVSYNHGMNVSCM